MEGIDLPGVYSVLTQMVEHLEKQHPELKNTNGKKPSGLIVPATVIPKNLPGMPGAPGGQQ